MCRMILLSLISILSLSSLGVHCEKEDKKIPLDSKFEQQILTTPEEQQKYQKLKEYREKLVNVIGEYTDYVQKSFELNEPIDKEKVEQYKKQISKYEKEYTEKLKEFFNFIGPEKVFLWAIEVDKTEPEASGWILFYGGLSDWKTNPQAFLNSYIYFNKYRERMSEKFKNDTEESMYDFTSKTMTLEQEKGTINEAIKFLSNPKNQQEYKVITMQFLWDVWNVFWTRVEKMDKKSEIYEEMNKQVLRIIETASQFNQDVVLAPKVEELLEKFKGIYTKEELPEDFKNSPSYLTVSQILKTYIR